MAMPSPLFTKLRHSFLYLTTIIMQFSGESVGNYVRTFVYKLNVQLNMCLKLEISLKVINTRPRSYCLTVCEVIWPIR